MNRLLGNTRMTQIFPTEQDGDKPVAVNWDESLEHMELRFTLDNNPNLIQPLVSYLCERATAFGLCEATLEKHVAIALEESLLNALYHGNLELSTGRFARCRRRTIVARQRSVDCASSARYPVQSASNSRAGDAID